MSTIVMSKLLCLNCYVYNCYVYNCYVYNCYVFFVVSNGVSEEYSSFPDKKLPSESS